MFVADVLQKPCESKHLTVPELKSKSIKSFVLVWTVIGESYHSSTTQNEKTGVVLFSSRKQISTQT